MMLFSYDFISINNFENIYQVKWWFCKRSLLKNYKDFFIIFGIVCQIFVIIIYICINLIWVIFWIDIVFMYVFFVMNYIIWEK